MLGSLLLLLLLAGFFGLAARFGDLALALLLDVLPCLGGEGGGLLGALSGIECGGTGVVGRRIG
ncbi:hypothetical protein AB0O20_36045 [Streptomyces kronopolitis]|uniref:hypothetical protein n=1 Tax=Streptomyces kronopolitis TaxID=1612435 RepID=UPI003436F15C